MLSDIDIARAAKLKPIADIASRIGVPESALFHYGPSIAKLDPEFLESLADRPDGKLILVTAISPTPAGEGKTTTTVGLGDALNRIGRKTIICLREPSLGPCFGMKGGAAGGGYAQVVPMDAINLHFTGDFHAITSAHNLLAAMIDNHLYWGNALGLDPRRIVWRRALDMNDRALRETTIGLGGPGNGFPRQDRFDITVASEVMAAFCLAAKFRGPGAQARPHDRRRDPRQAARHGERAQSRGRYDRAAQGRDEAVISCRRSRDRRRWFMAVPSPTSLMAATRSWRPAPLSSWASMSSPRRDSALISGPKSSSTSSAVRPGSIRRRL